MAMNSDLLAMVTYMERERGVNRDVILRAIADALQTVAKRATGATGDVNVVIDPRSLAVKISYTATVVDGPAGPGEIDLHHARYYNRNAVAGQVIDVPVPMDRLGRIGAQSVRQMILQKIREATNVKLFDDYKNRVGEIVTGTVRQIQRRNVFVDLGGNAEAILSARDRIGAEDFQIGDQVRAYLKKVQNDQSGPVIHLSRTCPEFLKALFRNEVSEVYEGVVEIMGVARDPGYRAKVAVRTHDDKIDPVGACVGMKGARVRNIVSELHGEKIDIVRWNEDPRIYVQQALSPARLEAVSLDPDDPKTVIVSVSGDEYSLAIGKRGQNVRLTEKLTGLRLQIERTDEEKPLDERVQDVVNALAEDLGISVEIAEALHNGGFNTREGIQAATVEDICDDCGLDEDTAHRVWNLAVGVNAD